MIFHLSSTNSTPYHGAMVPQQWFLSLVLIFLLFQLCTSADTVTPTQSVTGDQILVSKGENFALGFFSPANSTNRYIGIWYHKVPEKTVVWVANRDNPVQDSTGVLIINRDGNLVVLHGDRKTPLWSTNVSSTTNNTIAKLLDSGNLALCGPPSETVLWQSFDHPTNIWLPGVKLGLNQRTGLNTILTSWRSRDDPAVGDYSFGLDPRGSPQFFLYMSSARRWRTGPWNGFGFSGIPAMRLSYIVKDIFVSHSDEIYWEWTIPNSSILSTFILNESGLVQRQGWLEEIGRWNVFGSFPRDRCDEYRRCEGYGICNNENIAECECLPGFEPKSSELWYMRDWSGGCVRKRTLECGKGEGFLKLSNVKLPDTSISRVDMSLSLKDCKKDCLRNCSCTGYASADITGEGSGCIGWYGELMDIRKFTDGGQDFYVRVDAAELAQARSDSKGFLDKKRMVVILGVSIVVGVFFLVLSGYFVLKKRKTKGAIENRRTSRSLSFRDSLGSKELEDSRTNPELPIFELNVVVAATDNFSSSNKLGEGGFGSVYKGLLSNGQEIAVKRLSKKSGQGVEELKNEVRSIAQLQHRNLVRLLGCCIQEEEKMLIYEYMPNKSLDTFIFDQSRKALLSWRRRFEIIVGIARGILYLHQDSRLRIIHRDLKASNVLLDAEMTPKISDFGMARIFGGNQSEANTNRVVGTYGYMSPEYAMEGQFSIKSDVYSFGVLLLEIISGKKNNDYYQEDPSLNLIGHAWDRWRESKVWNIVDSSIRDLCPTHEVLRCIQVALLCVQESALDRPTMSQVVYMLDNETTMPPPKRPAFVMRTIKNTDSMSTGAGSSSVNEVMITEIEAR